MSDNPGGALFAVALSFDDLDTIAEDLLAEVPYAHAIRVIRFLNARMFAQIDNGVSGAICDALVRLEAAHAGPSDGDVVH